MGSFRYLLLSLLAFLIVFTVTSCDNGGTTTKTVDCTVPTECKANQDCVFDSLTAEKGVCTNRVVCEANTDCSDGLLCADDGGTKFCGTRDVFGIKAVTLDDAKKDEFYPIVKLEVTGSQAEYSFEVLDASKLPAGLELSPEGNLSGTVTADVGEYTFTVKAINGPKDATHYYNYREATADLTIKVVEGAVTCKVDSCTEVHKTVCSVKDDAIVCSCDTGYQDNDDNGSCEVTCAMSNLGCTDTQHCDDSTGAAACACNENWEDDGNGGKCNACVTGMHINPDDATVCDSDLRTVTCTNVPDASIATWDDAFDNGDFEQTWVNGEYIPNVAPDKCLWKCNDTNKVHDVDANQCICSSGLVDDGNGGCKTPCFDNQISNADGTCSCYPGYGGEDCLACATGYKPVDGRCVFDCSDKANTHVNNSGDACECDEGYFPLTGGNGECVNPCQGDNAPDCGVTKACVPVDETTTNCICDSSLNFVDDGAGNCGCDTANTNRVLATTGDSCVCDSDNGYAEDLDGTCSLDTACTVDSFTSADPINDSYATAADLTSALVDGMVHYDNLNNQAIDCSSTEDWYKVSVAANQKLSVNINFANADGNLDLKLYVGGDGYGDDIETSSSSSSDEEAVEHIFREDTDVYIKVYSPSYALAKNTYSMDVKVADVAPITELNGGDTCADAVEITQSGTYSGTTTGFNNDFEQEASCLNENEAGNDVLYSVTIEPGQTLNAKLTATYPDDAGNNATVVLYLVDNCTDMNCSASSSHWTLSSPVSLEYLNSTSESQTLFLVLDAWGADLSGPNTSKINIDYTLDVEFSEGATPVVCAPSCDADKEVCSNVDGTATCTCDADKGYFDNGFACVNPCLSATCDSKPNSTCVSSSAMDYTCECDDGYTELNGVCLQEQAFPGGDTCGDGSTLPEITETGIYTGSVNSNDTTLECSYDDGNDVFYKLVLTEESYINITETEDIDTFNATMALRDSCDATTDLKCEYLDDTGITGLYPAGTYYLVVEGGTGDVNYSLSVAINPSPCIGVTCDGTNESGVCTPSDDGSTYTCECSDNYFKNDAGACVSPCDTATCPDANANGTGICVGTSLTEYTCGCSDNYFEVIANDGTRTCESGCEATALDCSTEGSNVECRSTSATEAECACADNYADTDDTDSFNCVAYTNGGDTCTDAVSIAEGTYYGSTDGFNNDYTNEATCITEDEKGNDVVYSVEVPAGYTLSSTLNADVSWVGLYLLDDCSAMNCLVANNSSTEQPPVTIEYTNRTDAPITLFMVLDSFHTDESMNYQLDVALTPPPLCGNGVVDTADGEECDNSNVANPLNGATCSLGGTISCDDQCMLVKTQCWECDGADDAAQCTEAGKTVCYVDTHTCGAAQAECGNNAIESPEECDGTASFDDSCPAGNSGVKTCVAAGEANECTINDTACQVCEDAMTLASDPKNDAYDNALPLTLDDSGETIINSLTLGLLNSSSCEIADDWYKLTVTAGTRVTITTTDDVSSTTYGHFYMGGSALANRVGDSSDVETNVRKSVYDVTADADLMFRVYNYSDIATYSLDIKVQQTCTDNSECNAGNGMCLDGVCYDADPCSAVTCDSTNGTGVCTPFNETDYSCECNAGYFEDATHTCVDPCAGNTCDVDKPNSECIATSLDVTSCECITGFNELDGNCVVPQDVVGADTCDPDTSIPVIDASGIWTGTVTQDNNSPGCRTTTGRNDVLYKVVLAEDSYLSVDGSDDNFDGYTAFREVCADDSNELECGDFGYSDSFSGFYTAGTYYLLIEAYSATESDPYKISVIIKPNPCNGVTCDATNGTDVCTPSDDATTYTCECNANYFFDGNNACVTPCATDTCDAKADSTCIATSATDFTCECNTGFFDDNGTCVNPCAGNTCDATSEVCVAVDATNYNCECADGYVSDGNGACVADLGVDACTDTNLYTIDASGTFYGTTNGSATDYDCGAGSGHDVVYAIDLNTGDQLDVTLSSSEDTVLFLMKTCSNEAANCLVEKDNGLGGDDESFSFTAQETATYIIGLRRWGTTTDMDYSLTVDLTANTTPACTIDTDCTDATLPKCKVDTNDAMNNVCVACLADADCTDATNTVCNLTTNVCEAPAATTTVGWCNTQSPEAIATNGETVYGRVYVSGVTDVTTDTADASISAELCYFADGDTNANSTCVTAGFNAALNTGNNDEYMAVLPDLADGTYHYYFQFKTADDANYLLCDLNNTTTNTNGTAYNSGDTYQGDTGVATIATTTSNLVANGNFEAWTTTTPDSWTTIDTGVDLAQEQTIVHGGSSSMAVTVNTGSQKNTDIRQTINVTNGVTYNVSVWIYHPANTHLKVTIYDDAYSNKFSDNTILDGWQELTHSFTASADTAEIGLRFYDQSGFVAGEVVYIDDYTITPQ